MIQGTYVKSIRAGFLHANTHEFRVSGGPDRHQPAGERVSVEKCNITMSASGHTDKAVAFRDQFTEPLH